MIPFEVEFDAPEPASTPPSPPPEKRIVTTEKRPEPQATGYTSNYRNGKNGSSSRELPHSSEDEEALLSCLMIDGVAVVDQCQSAHITANSLYYQNNGVVLDAIYALRARQEPIDASTVASELQATNRLDSVGGIPFITHVSGQVPTTAQAGFFISRIREQSLQREAIRTGKRFLEEAYTLRDGVDDFLSSYQEKLKKISEGSPKARDEEIESRAFDPTKQIEKPVPIYTLAGTTISTPGNITAIYSQAKTGKSSLIGAMIAAAMTTPTSGYDTLGINGPNYAKHAVLHFDTEQSPYDWQQLVKSSMRRANVSKPPAWLMSYILTGMSAQACRDFIESTMKRAKRIHGGIHSVIIDGIADLVVDPNDPAECFPLITKLHGSAITYNTSIITVLHMNPGKDEKGRGHLGSQLERKAESNLTMEKDGEVTRVWGVKQRGKTISKDDAQTFSWSDEKQMHVSCEMAESAKRTGRKPKYEFAQFKEYLAGPADKFIPLAEMYRKVSQGSDIPRNSFRDLMARAYDANLVQRTIDPVKGICYRLVAPTNLFPT